MSYKGHLPQLYTIKSNPDHDQGIIQLQNLVTDIPCYVYYYTLSSKTSIGS